MRDLMPVGGGLSRRQWRKRHAAVVLLLQVHLPVLLVLGLALGQRPRHLLVELVVPAAAVLVARRPALADTTRALAASLGLVTCSALLVHISSGSVESHFHFFVVVSLVALYESWLVLSASVGLIVLHHLVLGAVDPALVYGAHGAWSWPVAFAVHALAITAQCCVALAHWRAHEGALAAERRLGRRLLDRESALQEAVRNAEVGAFASDVAHRANTPVQYAADNARFLGDAVLELSELVTQTRAVLDALPVERRGPDLERLRDLHREHHKDWGADNVQGALADCLSGLEEMAHLVLSLQDVAVSHAAHERAPAAPTAAASSTGDAA